MPKLKIKKGDNVVVISGRDKGKRGEVLRVFPDENRLIVQGVHIARRHTRAAARRAGRDRRQGADDPRLERRAYRPAIGQADADRLQNPR